MKSIIVALVLMCIVPYMAIPTPIAKADTPIMEANPPIMDSRAMALGKFFESHNCPLLPYVDNFIAAADKYKIDWRLLPAISFHESTCGKKYPLNTNNPFGWHPIRTAKGEISVFRFNSLPDSIDFITGQLANNSPYAGKTIEGKLHKYCPSPSYPAETIGYMKKISNE